MQRFGVEAVRLDKKLIDASDLRPVRNLDLEKMGFILILAAGLIYSAVVLVPIGTLFGSSGIKGVVSAAASGNNISALGMSLLTSTLTLVLVFITGTPVVYLLSRPKSGVPARFLEVLVGIPTVLPPAVAGIALLLAFGRDGFFGALLSRFNMEIVFTPFAVVIAQFFVASGFYVQTLKNGVDSVSRDIIEASYVFGAGKLETFIRVILPMLKKTVASGLVMSWTRALGEFGATIMFAGNVLGRTRTAPLQIYTLMQTDIRHAAALSAVMLVISSLMIFITKILLKENML